MRFVVKFGGSSLSSITKVKKVANFLSHLLKTKADELIVVVSAMGKTTNQLIEIAKKIDKQNRSIFASELISQGENISASVLALALDNISVPCKILTAKQIKIHCKGDNQNAIITHIDTQKILSSLEEKKIIIIPGFQAVNQNEETCLLGRGGSDTTASALASVLDAELIIYTDVPGYFSCDPSQVENAKKLETLNIHNAIELSYCGAKIMEPKSLEIANKNKTKISICESLTENKTKIVYDQNHNFKIDAISFKNNLNIITSNDANFPQIFKKICKNKLQIIYYDDFFVKNAKYFNLINTSFIQKDIKEIKNIKNTKINHCELITIVGSGFLNNEKLKVDLQKIIKNNKFFTFLISISSTNIKIAVRKNKALSLVKILHKELLEC